MALIISIYLTGVSLTKLMSYYFNGFNGFDYIIVWGVLPMELHATGYCLSVSRLCINRTNRLCKLRSYHCEFAAADSSWTRFWLVVRHAGRPAQV